MINNQRAPRKKHIVMDQRYYAVGRRTCGRACGRCNVHAIMRRPWLTIKNTLAAVDAGNAPGQWPLKILRKVRMITVYLTRPPCQSRLSPTAFDLLRIWSDGLLRHAFDTLDSVLALRHFKSMVLHITGGRGHFNHSLRVSIPPQPNHEMPLGRHTHLALQKLNLATGLHLAPQDGALLPIALNLQRGGTDADQTAQHGD